MKKIFIAFIMLAFFSSYASAETLMESVNKECFSKKPQSDKCLVKGLSYTIIRTINSPYHYLFVPAVSISGVESPELWQPGYPAWFQTAWRNRHIAATWLGDNISQSDVGIAINSRPRRTQNQLHVHFNCIRNDVKNDLNSKSIGQEWSEITLTSVAAAGHYQGILLPGSDIPDNLLPDLAKKHPEFSKNPENMSLFAMQLVGGKTVVLATNYDPANPRSGSAQDLLTNCSGK